MSVSRNFGDIDSFTSELLDLAGNHDQPCSLPPSTYTNRSQCVSRIQHTEAFVPRPNPHEISLRGRNSTQATDRKNITVSM